jgi:pyruvate dehydrogenase E1 component alpha subunit
MLFEDYDPLNGKMLQVLGVDGVPNKDLEPNLNDKLLVKIYEHMVLTRTADEKAVNLQRQGKMGTYPPSRGQEASQIGPAVALKSIDWLVTGFRELGALLWRGVPLWRFYLYWMGNEEGSNFPEELNVTPPVVPVGDQIPHAVGVSYASKYRNQDAATLVYFGDGGSSEGSFHEGLNLAGVFKTPTVFVCQNNQYAISLPRSHQTASKTIAQKAVSYGFPGLLVDGNDILALYLATSEALKRARKGDGPTLIESFTYRIGDHTTSDDASRYRSQQELKDWEEKDPLKRFKVYLEGRGLLTKESEKEAIIKITGSVNEAVDKALSYPIPTIEEIFKYTYANASSYLNEQMERLKLDLSEKGD